MENLNPSAVVKPDVTNSDLYWEIVQGRRTPIAAKPADAILSGAQMASAIYGAFFPKCPGIVLYKPLIRFDAGESRRPDLAFITMEAMRRDPYRAQRLQKCVAKSKPVETSLIPNIAVEMISPDITFGFIHERTFRYLKAGVQFVWHVYYATKRLY